MKVFLIILRSFLAIVVGAIAANLAITVMHVVSEVIVAPPPELKENFRKIRSGAEFDRDRVRDLMQSMPVGAFLLVLLSWELGAFVGGAVAALIAGWGRLLFAGIIGTLVLAATVAIVMMVPGHPNWLILAGLLLPLPVSLIAGKIVSMLLPLAPIVELPDGAIKAGEPPM